MLKQTLLAFTVLGFAGTAAAADITNPFFLPESLHMASVTSFDFARAQRKSNGTTTTVNTPGTVAPVVTGTDAENTRVYGKLLTEKLQFGILNNLALIGEVGKTWLKGKDRLDGTSAKWHNDLDWNAGLAWNILHCNTKLQVSSVYGQEAPRNPQRSVLDHQGTYKYFDTEVKLGYQFKTFLPYVTFNVHTPVAQTEQDRLNKWSYNGKVGVYQGKCGVWSLDTALAWKFDRTAEHARTLAAEAEASYYLTKNMTVGVYGSYMLDGKAKNHTDLYDKTVGARLRLYF